MFLSVQFVQIKSLSLYLNPMIYLQFLFSKINFLILNRPENIPHSKFPLFILTPLSQPTLFFHFRRIDLTLFFNKLPDIKNPLLLVAKSAKVRTNNPKHHIINFTSQLNIMNRA